MRDAYPTYAVMARQKDEPVLSELASIATAASVLVASYQLWQGRKQARADFEHRFIERYWALEDEHLRAPDDETNYPKRYLRLCEDEFEAKRLKQVGEATWRVWHDAIRQGTRIHREAADGFDWVRTCLRDSHPHAPKDCPGITESVPVQPGVEPSIELDRPLPDTGRAGGSINAT